MNVSIFFVCIMFLDTFDYAKSKGKQKERKRNVECTQNALFVFFLRLHLFLVLSSSSVRESCAQHDSQLTFKYKHDKSYLSWFPSVFVEVTPSKRPICIPPPLHVPFLPSHRPYTFYTHSNVIVRTTKRILQFIFRKSFFLNVHLQNTLPLFLHPFMPPSFRPTVPLTHIQM